MKPAFSVILFTVASGAGFGLIMLGILFDLFGLGGGLDRSSLLAAGGLAFVLISVGLLASTAHLANPKNAWRSFSRFKTSWLSKEGVFAVLFYPFFLLYMLGVYSGAGSTPGWALFFGVIAFLLGLATLFSTGMIYASLKTIRQWSSPLVPVNYLTKAFSTGILLLYALGLGGLQPVSGMIALAAALILLAAMVKSVYYFWVAQPAGPTINTATGFTRAKVQILDPGHSYGTFLTHEFGYVPPANLVKGLKVGVYVFTYLLPLVLLWPAAEAPGSGVMWVAAVSALAGAAMERWLFFAEARHVVNLYHGAQTT
ncbi:dimethyl sulfoxide reductase anchor subunit family protein [Thiohalorhabdus methylotrophus]|uniref:Dimethyl sulfoxide reductase anchor subunit family protein n=1 Tax=Thiohalorhabdus methylotrophus TaxID=3242694 RepID=A0ABV4TRA7_9GAMM